MIEIKHIKDTVARKFHPIMQHDSHEFLAYVLGTLQEEETADGTRFNGSDEMKSQDDII